MKYAKPVFSEIPYKKTIFRKSYTPLPIKVEKLTMFLEFENPSDISSSQFFITGVFEFKFNAVDFPNGAANLSDLLELDGQVDFLELLNVRVLGSNLEAKYFVRKDKIVFDDKFVRQLISSGNNFKMVFKAKVRELGNNRSGRGFYLSGRGKQDHLALTLMEPFGFSHLFFMQDRPDILALYDVILLNYKNSFTLLSGGELNSVNLFDYLEGNGLKGAINLKDYDENVLLISDEHPKPTYLFQLIFLPYENETDLILNGKMKIRERTRHSIDSINTSTTIVRLIREASGYYDDTSFALESLEKVMKFDENFSGHNYDSKNLTLVAATDFNSGAREMRNFMIFSPSKLLANRDISTIDDFYNVERIVAHEYLHHISGNRITMRDFFEVTLKEGLTVLRDMYFREHVGIYGSCSRLEAVTKLRKTQWVQDNGPKAHSVRPDSIDHKGDFEVSLFTTTVYEKGAEIIRMIQEMIEPDVEIFSKLLNNNYLSGPIRASTIDELVDSFELESKLSSVWFSREQFMKWFLVKGTPIVSVYWTEQDTNIFELKMSQITKNGFDDEVEYEMLIPIRIAFFNNFGEQINDFDIIGPCSGLFHVRDDLFVLNKSEGRLFAR